MSNKSFYVGLVIVKNERFDQLYESLRENKTTLNKVWIKILFILTSLMKNNCLEKIKISQKISISPEFSTILKRKVYEYMDNKVLKYFLMIIIDGIIKLKVY